MTELFRPFATGLPISLIATPSENLMTCSAQDRLADVLKRNVESFDHIPVIDEQRHIVGVFSTHAEIHPFHWVGEVAVPLSSSHIIGAESPIISFIREVKAQPFRFVVDQSGISGLVTWSDMQKLPARAALFALVTQLEMCMSAAIEREFPNETWRCRLKKKRQDDLDQEVEKAKQRDSFVNSLLYTQFCDKRDILSASMGGRTFSRTLRKIEGLRNDLAHANLIADRKESALLLSEVVLLMERYIVELAGNLAETA